MVLTGNWRFDTRPRWKQLLGIPLRPWRYTRMVRHIAATRNMFYAPSDYDDVA